VCVCMFVFLLKNSQADRRERENDLTKENNQKKIFTGKKEESKRLKDSK